MSAEPGRAVGIADQRDTRAAVRVILNGSNRGRDPVLVALEVYEAQLLLVSATMVTHRHRARAVAAASARLHGEKRLMWRVGRDVIVDQLRREAE